ncbi:MAG: amidohydrolase [Aurantimicrobium sp.]|uniref:amidohydrolase n=2 Tax=Aurantimicrobium sp. TaxID=1930784 RepID=UPI002FC9A165
MRSLQALESPPLLFAPRIIRAKAVLTMDDDERLVEAFLIVDSTILFVGNVEDCKRESERLFGRMAEVLDFGDSCIVPGFIDAHAHPLMYGQMMTWVDCGPDKAKNIPEIIELLTEQASKIPAGLPIRGYGYEQRNLAEKRHPTRHELDRVATDREVYLMNASGHGGVVNSYLLDLNGITRETPNPGGGEFFRDEHGELTGELSDAACNILTGLEGVKIGHHGPNFHLADEPEEHVRQLAAAQEDFLSHGVTTVGDAQVTRRELDTYLRLAEANQLKNRFSMYLLSHLLDEVIELGLHGQFGNSRLSFAGIKFYADGTLGGWTAYFPDGYVGDPCRTGQLYHEPEKYQEMIVRAHKNFIQTATHAQSPDAIEMVVSAIESALRERPDVDARHRIEHCGLPTPNQIERMAASGIYPVNQTQHYYNWGEGVEDAIGTPGERFNPLGEYERAGVPITISSDAPVAKPRPLEAIQVASDRITRNGNKLGDDNLCISVASALRATTIGAARALGREFEIGSIEIGKKADFAILTRNPLATEISNISGISVLQTWVDGICQYTNSEVS